MFNRAFVTLRMISHFVGWREQSYAFGIASMILLASSLVGCMSTDQQPVTRSPVLTLEDSTPLIESDSQYVGSPGGIAITSDGRLFVSDTKNKTVWLVRRDGRIIGQIGRSGQGPLEFDGGPSTLLLRDDSTLLVQVGLTISAVSLHGPAQLWRRRLPGLFPPTEPMAASGGSFLYREIDADSRSTLARVMGESDSAERGGPFPQEYGNNRLIDDLLGVAQATWLAGDTVAVALEASDYLYVGPFQGPFDSVLIARIHRNGTRHDLIASLETASPEEAAKAAYALSVPWTLERLGPSMVGLVTVDAVPLKTRLGGRLYLTVVDLAKHRSCPDAAVEVPVDPFPEVAIDGDTLIVIDQGLVGDSAPQTFVNRYSIDVGQCTWSDG